MSDDISSIPHSELKQNLITRRSKPFIASRASSQTGRRRPWDPDRDPPPPSVSCFQNDISLATEDQQARRNRGASVSGGGGAWRRQTGHHGSDLGDDAVFRVKWARRIFMGCFGDCLFTEEPGRDPVSPPRGPGRDHTAQM